MRSLLKKKEELLRQYFPNLPQAILRYFQPFPVSEIRLALMSYYFSDVYELLDYLKGKEKKDTDEEITIYTTTQPILVYENGKFYNLDNVRIPFPYFYRFRRRGKCVVCGKEAINSSIDICLEHYSQLEADEISFNMTKNRTEMFLEAMPYALPQPKHKLYLTQSALDYLPFILKSMTETKVWMITPYLDLVWMIIYVMKESLIYVPCIYADYLHLLPWLPSPYIVWSSVPVDYEGVGMIIIDKAYRELKGVKVHIK